jgi:hypothetical protein
MGGCGTDGPIGKFKKDLGILSIYEETPECPSPVEDPVFKRGWEG